MRCTTFRPGFRWVSSAAGLVAFALGVGSLACGGTEAGDGLPLLTIAECQDLGGAPLFDPEDERPIQESCPDGLYFAGEFDEEFFGADGGLCCVSPEPVGHASDTP